MRYSIHTEADTTSKSRQTMYHVIEAGSEDDAIYEARMAHVKRLGWNGSIWIESIEPVTTDDPWGRRVIRGDGCQHPGLTDTDILNYHDAGTYGQYMGMQLHCTVPKSHVGRDGTLYEYVCGYWYTFADSNDDVHVVDEPPGAGR